MTNSKKEAPKTSLIKKFFMIIGIVVTILIILVILLIGILALIKPYGIDVIQVVPAMLDSSPTSSYDHPNLTTQQESILESAGINPADVPTEITPAQLQCSSEALGVQRANEIAGGSTPTLTDVFKAKHCFE